MDQQDTPLGGKTPEFFDALTERIRNEWEASGSWDEYHDIGDTVLGLKFVGAGVSRSTFDIGNGYVVKVSRNRRDSIQMRWEINAWETMREEHKKWAVPIVAHSKEHLWIIMPKAEMDHDKAEEVWDGLEREIGEWFTDIHPGNIGFIDGGRPVMVDYAHYRY